MRRDHQARSPALGPQDLERELDRAFELEAAGWKGAAGTAIDSAKETALFYRSVAGAYERLGELCLSTITLDGELAAFDLCLLHANRLWTLKGSYNESYRHLSPGMVLLMWEIERSYELGLEAVELLGGDEDYKLAFATSQREHLRFRAYRRRPAPLARFAYWRWARPLIRTGYSQLSGRPAQAAARAWATSRPRPESVRSPASVHSPASARGSDPAHGPARAAGGPQPPPTSGGMSRGAKWAIALLVAVGARPGGGAGGDRGRRGRGRDDDGHERSHDRADDRDHHGADHHHDAEHHDHDDDPTTTDTTTTTTTTQTGDDGGGGGREPRRALARCPRPRDLRHRPTRAGCSRSARRSPRRPPGRQRRR